MERTSDRISGRAIGRWGGVVAIVSGILWGGLASGAENMDLRHSLFGSADEFDAIKVFSLDGGKDLKVVYGDRRGILHVLQSYRNGFKEEWASPSLRSEIGEVFVDDLDGDGKQEILCYTTKGKLYIFDTSTYRVIWQNTDSEYTSMTCMTVTNTDGDPQKEIVFFADQRLRVYDGKNRFEEWKSDQEYTGSDVPTDILIADMDGDGGNEIILNSGFVLDARFLDVKWRSPDRFGDKLGAMDIDGDGMLELIGESDGKFLRVFDVDLRREKL
jgi:outer membrane protein assembly factor BamB